MGTLWVHQAARQSMPPLPPGLGEWVQPGLLTGFFGVLWYAITTQAKRIDELRADIKEIRSDLKASEARQEARQREDMAELKADNRALAEKLDRLVESLLAAKQS